MIECCIYHTRKLFRLIILYFRINVHRRFAVLMSSQILNCFRINPCIKKIGYVCMSQLMGRHFKIQTVNNLGIVLLMSSQSWCNRVLDVLYKLIRELSISADSIFYPEKPSKDSEVENLLRMLSACDERSLEVVKATVKALIDTAPEK